MSQYQMGILKRNITRADKSALEKRAKLAAGAPGLDMHNMRPALEKVCLMDIH